MVKNKSLWIYYLIGVLVVIGIICLFLFISPSTKKTDENNSNLNIDNNISDSTKETVKKDNFIQNITNNDMASKIKSELIDWNNTRDSNLALFTNITVSESDKTILVKYTITDDAKSVLMLRFFGIATGLKVYEANQNFDKLNIIYLDAQNKKQGEITIPNKAIKDVYDYNALNPESDILDNPYLEAYDKLSTTLYDPSLPTLIPESMAEDQFGNGADNASEIDSALAKKVTHLEIDCMGGANWDADAEDDGITYYLKPTSADGTIVPLEGSFSTEAYEVKRTDDWKYIKGEKVYTRTDTIEGSQRFDYFDLYSGYNIRLDWSQVTPYMSSSEDDGYLYVTFTDKQNNSYSAKIEDTYSSCKLR